MKDSQQDLRGDDACYKYIKESNERFSTRSWLVPCRS